MVRNSTNCFKRQRNSPVSANQRSAFNVQRQILMVSSINANLIFLHIILAIIPDERWTKAFELNSLFQGYPLIKELWNNQNQDEYGFCKSCFENSDRKNFILRFPSTYLQDH